MLEVEYKAAVQDMGMVEERLVTLGAVPGATQEETDLYYAHPQRDFATTDEALRVRTRTIATDPLHILTYKGPRVAGPTRAREEFEVTLQGDITPILTRLAFRLAGRVHKTRRSFDIDGLTVTLDQVEGLGAFVEVEVLAPRPGDADADEDPLPALRERVLALVDRLGLGPEETRSYLEMVLEDGR